MASGGCYQPPNRIKNVKKTANAINMNFYKCYENPLAQILKQVSKFYQLWGPVTWPLLEGWYTRNSWFSRFLEYISASFWYFFMKSFLLFFCLLKFWCLWQERGRILLPKKISWRNIKNSLRYTPKTLKSMNFLYTTPPIMVTWQAPRADKVSKIVLKVV